MKAICPRMVTNEKKHWWDTRKYQFCFRECVKDGDKWKCPVHGEELKNEA